MYADIIIDITHEKLDKVFQYRVPEELEGDLRTGAGVIVPFGRGNRETKGYIVGFSETCDYDAEKIKDILRTDTSSVAIEARLVALAAWMKEYYGIWSQVAHNASFDSLDMLGFNMEDENHKRFYVQPSYTENTIEAFNMNIGLFMLFAMEVANFMEKAIPDYKPIEEMKFVLSLNEYGSKTNIPYFKSLKGMRVRYEDEA